MALQTRLLRISSVIFCFICDLQAVVSMIIVVIIIIYNSIMIIIIIIVTAVNITTVLIGFTMIL